MDSKKKPAVDKKGTQEMNKKGTQDMDKKGTGFDLEKMLTNDMEKNTKKGPSGYGDPIKSQGVSGVRPGVKDKKLAGGVRDSKDKVNILE
mmetsp:Transcript_39481/g.37936  ORF Transcript_39481/g.37936 Transcript_39481/m.37936 type:complete len:90 (-) Transcript_39481:1927-2196(-)